MQFEKSWFLGEFFCKFNSFAQLVSVIASVLTLSIISYDRYLGIVKPLKSKLTNTKTFIFIALIWLVSIVISIPAFIYRSYTVRKWADYEDKVCDDLDWPISFDIDEHNCIQKITKPAKRIYFTAIILMLFFFPIIIMSITYSFIINILWKNKMIGEGKSNIERSRTLIKKRKKVIIIYKKNG
jgi:hypothetical protein